MNKAISKTRAAVRVVSPTAEDKPVKAKLFEPPVKSSKTSKVKTEQVVGNKGMIHDLPVELAMCADLLYQTQQKRFEINKEVERLQSIETALKNKIIANLPKSQATGISGLIGKVSLTKKDTVQVKDWNVYYDFLVSEFNKEKRKKNGQEYGVFSLLQKRAGDTAIKERWAEGKIVPGTEKFTVVDVSITKV